MGQERDVFEVESAAEHKGQLRTVLEELAGPPRLGATGTVDVQAGAQFGRAVLEATIRYPRLIVGPGRPCPRT